MATPQYIASTRKVYGFSAAHYVSAVGTTVTPEFERPIDRATLNAFAEDLVTVPHARVLDIGCGVGRVTRYLYDRGLDVQGFDLSSEMVSAARSAHPQLTFGVAPMTELPIDSGSVAAAVLWYSIIHTPLSALPDVWNELTRVLAPGGRVMLAFQAGHNEEVRRENAYGSSTTITWYRHNSDDIVQSTERAGFVLQSRVWRVAQFAHETTPQEFLAFQRSATSTAPLRPLSPTTSRVEPVQVRQTQAEVRGRVDRAAILAALHEGRDA